MAKAGKKFSTAIWLSEAKALLARAYGGASQRAEKLLIEKFRAEPEPEPEAWGYEQKNGNAPDHEVWQDARVNFEECSATYRTGRAGRAQGLDTDWDGIWVSRAHLHALLPEAPTEHEEADGRIASKSWIVADVERMKLAGETWFGITDLSHKVHKRMREAARVDDRIHLIGVRSIEYWLRKCGLA